MSDPNKKTPRYLMPTTSQLLHEQESLRRRRQYLEAAEARRPVMRFGVDPPPVAKSFMPPPSATAAPSDARQTSHSAPPSSRDRGQDAPDVVLPPMRFSLASYHASPAPSARSHISASPTPRAVNTAATVSSRASSKGSHLRGAVSTGWLDSMDTSSTENAVGARGVKRQRSISENDNPATLLPDFPMRRERSSQKDSSVTSHEDVAVAGTHRSQYVPPPEQHGTMSPDGKASSSPPQATDSTNPPDEAVVASAVPAEVEAPVKHSPSGFPLPRSSAGVEARDENAGVFRDVPLPTPSRPSGSFTPLPVPPSTPLPVGRADEFPTPTYVPRHSLFASTPTPHKVAPSPSAEVPPLPTTDAQLTEEEYGSPAPTATQLLDSFAASEEKRCCRRPARSNTPPPTRTCTDGTSPEPTAGDAADTPSRRACGCQRPTPGSASRHRSASHASVKVDISPQRATSPELTPKHVLSSVVVSTEKRRDSGRPSRTMATATGVASSVRTPSPIPTAQGVEASLLASAEKRRVSGSPTPVSRTATTPEGVTVCGVELEVNSAAASSTPPAQRLSGDQPTATRESASPQPTAERLIDSLTTSAQKPTHRSKATSQDASPSVSAEARSPEVDMGLAPPPDFASVASPCLTPQNIEQSFAHRRPDNGRSGAPDPVHHSARSTASPTDWTAVHRSPSFDDAQVQASLGVIEDKLKNADRSVAAKRTSPLDGDFSAVDQTVWEMTCGPASGDQHAARSDAAEEEETGEQTAFSHEREASTHEEDVNAQLQGRGTENQEEEEDNNVMASDMFFDCQSAPPTAPPTPAIPEAYLQLQRDIEAISQGRSASHSVTPKPASTPQEVPAQTERGPADDPFLPESYTSSPEKKTEQVRSPASASASPVRASSGAPHARESIVLLEELPDRSQATRQRSHTPIARGAPIQHPHQPFDDTVADALAATEDRQLRANLSVSRSPPPSTSRHAVPHKASPVPRPLDHPSQSPVAPLWSTSPVPRPVTLRSQIRLVPHAAPGPATAPRGHALGGATHSPVADSQSPARKAPQSRDGAQNTSDILETSEEPPQRVISSMDQWQHTVEEDDRIFAVSPSTRVAVSVRYERNTLSAEPRTEVISLSRKRSRSPSDETESAMAVHKTIQDEDPATEVESRESQGTVRSSRGSGRKSRVEQLLEMLPASVAEEIASSSASFRGSQSLDAELLTTPSSVGRRSRVSTHEAVAEEVPTSVTPTPAKRGRKEIVGTVRSTSNASLCDVQVSPLSSVSAEQKHDWQPHRRSANATYGLVDGEVLATTTALSPSLQQCLYADAPTVEQTGGGVSPGTRKHLRHKKKMQKQCELKKANRLAQHAAAVTSAHLGTAEVKGGSSSGMALKKAKTLKKLKKAKAAKKEVTSPVGRSPVQSHSNKKKVKKVKKSKKLHKKQ